MAAGAPLRFDRLDKAADWGLTPDQAARQLHVRVDGRVIGAVGVSGVKAGEDARVARAGVDALLAHARSNPHSAA